MVSAISIWDAIRCIDSIMCNDCVVMLAGSITRTLQDVQNEKSEQQLEVYVSSAYAICLCTAMVVQLQYVHCDIKMPTSYHMYIYMYIA